MAGAQPASVAPLMASVPVRLSGAPASPQVNHRGEEPPPSPASPTPSQSSPHPRARALPRCLVVGSKLDDD